MTGDRNDDWIAAHGGEHRVRILGGGHLRCRFDAQNHFDAGLFDHIQLVLERMHKVIFEVRVAREPDLAAELVLPLVYRDIVAAPRGEDGRRQPSRAAADDDDLLRRRNSQDKPIEYASRPMRGFAEHAKAVSVS